MAQVHVFRGNVHRDFSTSPRQDEFIISRGDREALAAKVDGCTGTGGNPEQDPPADV